MSGYASYNSQPRGRSYVGLAWAVGIHCLLLFLIVSGIFKTTVEHILKKPLEAVVLQEVSLPPPPLPPPALKPLVNEPKPSVPVQQQPQQPAPIPAPVATDAPMKAEPAPAPVPMQVPVVNTPASHPVVAAPPAEPPHKVANTASAEAEYAARINALINASKRYPTGRQASQERPQGVVKVWFSLNRAGTLLQAGVLEAANSNLLNDAALSTVRRTVYPPFAAELWLGQDQHKFTVDIDFLPPT